MTEKTQEKKLLMWVGIVLVALILIVVAIFFVMKANGKSSIMKKAAVEGDTSGEALLFQDKEYTYNSDLINILVMGVDRDDPLDADNEVGMGGQSDVLFLVSLNKKDDTLKVYNIPRECMTVVRTLDDKGELTNVQTLQLTLQYAVGRNGIESSTLVSEATSELMCNIPIQRYAAVNFEAFPKINDAIGGVTVTVEESSFDQAVADFCPGYEVGKTLTLKGDAAFQFVRMRNSYVEESSVQRQERQVQYVEAFIPQAKKALKSDLTLPLKVKNIMDENMVTDLSMSELLYLATAFKNVNFEDLDMLTLPGNMILGNRYHEYYTDDVAIEDMIVENFYTEK